MATVEHHRIELLIHLLEKREVEGETNVTIEEMVGELTNLIESNGGEE